MKESSPLHASFHRLERFTGTAFDIKADEDTWEYESEERRLRRIVMDRLYESCHLLQLSDGSYQKLTQRLSASQMEITRYCKTGKIVLAHAELIRRCMHLFAEERAGIMSNGFISGILAVELEIPDRAWTETIGSHREWHPQLIEYLQNQTDEKSISDPIFGWAADTLSQYLWTAPETPYEAVLELINDMAAGYEFSLECREAIWRLSNSMTDMKEYENAAYLVQGLYTPLHFEDLVNQLHMQKERIVQEAATAQGLAALPIDAILLKQYGADRMKASVRRCGKRPRRQFQ